MDTVVAIHNNMNENTWQQILEWESLHSASTVTGAEPKLSRFTGRPNDLSPKAWIRTMLGQDPPFDRHDWIVDRGGKEVRYVIDYFHDEDSVHQDERPKSLTDSRSLKSIKVDVRPAVDSLDAVLDRLFSMPLAILQGKANYNPPPLIKLPKIVSSEDDQLIAKQAAIQSSCEKYKLSLEACSSELECLGASMKLQRCIGQVICPDLVKAFDMSLNEGTDLEPSFGKISGCIDEFNVRSKRMIQTKSTNNK